MKNWSKKFKDSYEKNTQKSWVEHRFLWFYHFNIFFQLCNLLSFPSTYTIQADADHIRDVLHWAIGQRIHSLDQLIVGDLSFLWILPNANDNKANAHNIPEHHLDALCEQLERATEFKNEQLLALLRNFAKMNDLNFTKFMQTLRARLSGTKNGPKVGEMMEILGPKLTIERIKRQANVTGNDNGQRQAERETMNAA